ncbi:hypothetical protein HJC23_009321 [Cyclotella cryptica]|uniref:Calmodulin n=1 Tax=Cyclotella cryptica TaxID=29204 RepID=A0ABD3QSW0_9STRA
MTVQTIWQATVVVLLCQPSSHGLKLKEKRREESGGGALIVHLSPSTIPEVVEIVNNKGKKALSFLAADYLIDTGDFTFDISEVTTYRLLCYAGPRLVVSQIHCAHQSKAIDKTILGPFSLVRHETDHQVICISFEDQVFHSFDLSSTPQPSDAEWIPVGQRGTYVQKKRISFGKTSSTSPPAASQNRFDSLAGNDDIEVQSSTISLPPKRTPHPSKKKSSTGSTSDTSNKGVSGSIDRESTEKGALQLDKEDEDGSTHSNNPPLIDNLPEPLKNIQISMFAPDWVDDGSEGDAAHSGDEKPPPKLNLQDIVPPATVATDSSTTAVSSLSYSSNPSAILDPKSGQNLLNVEIQIQPEKDNLERSYERQQASSDLTSPDCAHWPDTYAKAQGWYQSSSSYVFSLSPISEQQLQGRLDSRRSRARSDDADQKRRKSKRETTQDDKGPTSMYVTVNLYSTLPNIKSLLDSMNIDLRRSNVRVSLKSLQCWESSSKKMLCSVQSGLCVEGVRQLLLHRLKEMEKKLCRHGRLNTIDWYDTPLPPIHVTTRAIRELRLPKDPLEREELSFDPFPRSSRFAFFIEASEAAWTRLDPLLSMMTDTHDIAHTFGPSAFIMDVPPPNPMIERVRAHHKHARISMGYNIATTVIECSEVQLYDYEVKVKMAPIPILDSDGKPTGKEERPRPPYARTTIRKELQQLRVNGDQIFHTAVMTVANLACFMYHWLAQKGYCESTRSRLMRSFYIEKAQLAPQSSWDSSTLEAKSHFAGRSDTYLTDNAKYDPYLRKQLISQTEMKQTFVDMSDTVRKGLLQSLGYDPKEKGGEVGSKISGVSNLTGDCETRIREKNAEQAAEINTLRAQMQHLTQLIAGLSPQQGAPHLSGSGATRPQDEGGGTTGGHRESDRRFSYCGDDVTTSSSKASSTSDAQQGVGVKKRLASATSNGSNRTARQIKSQRRRDAWLNNQISTAMKRKYRAFLAGYDKFSTRCCPTDDDIVKEVRRQGREGDTHTASTQSALCTEQREMAHLIDLLKDGGVGFMPERKAGGWIRLMFENWNSLGISTHTWKIDRLNHLITSLQVDVIAGCESQCDWRLVPPHQQFLHLLAPGNTKSGIASNNVNERINRDQAGGTAIAAIGRLGDVVKTSGCDRTGLGRWSWIQLASGGVLHAIISGYLPCKPGKQARGRTVWEQHSRYFQARGDFRYPSTILIEDLTNQILEWRKAGEEVLLCIDSNQDVYTGPLAIALRQASIQMSCMIHQALGEQVPNSHFRGSGKLSTIFGTPGLLEGNAMCYPHWYGVGDHRVFLLELSANSLFGGEYPAIARPTSRQLTCKINRVRTNYCKALTRLVREHNMPVKLTRIQALSGMMSPSASQAIHDKWDQELGEFMSHAERKCTKFRNCSIEYSPTVGQWLRRRSVLKWLLRWHDGKVQDTRNMSRAARRAQIESPLTLTREDILARLQACLQEIFQLKSQAPALRRKHLKWRLSLARERGDDEAAQEILRISRNEARRLRQRNINRVVRTPQGRSVLSVSVDINGTDHHYSTQGEVEDACGQHLGERFSLGKRAPLDASHLRAVIGNLSDTEAAQRILDNNYDFSTDWDPATVDLLKAAARIRLELGAIEQTSTSVTAEDFRSFWATCKENTSSSKSGRHFGHYRAMSSDDLLTSLQVMSINIAASRGTPLSRWRQGVTVLLEKIAGNTRIDKLRAICLLEADFNWWLKATFAKKMIHRMSTKANTLHKTCAISSNDAANCYDAVNHAAGSFALQAMRVPLNFVKCYLICIQLMRFYLKTGFGMATDSYGGTKLCPYMGLAQGSGAAPAAWTAISTVMVEAYKAKGFGAYFKSGWSCLLLTLAALLYVDDTDLLHMSQEDETSKKPSLNTRKLPPRIGPNSFNRQAATLNQRNVTGTCFLTSFAMEWPI